MRFEGSMQVTQNVAGADPIADPELVKTNQLLLLNARQPSSDVWGKRILLALEGAAGETVTCELWALDEETAPNSNADSPTGIEDRKFYRFATGLVLTANIMAEVTAACPPGGTVYLRRTADTIAASQTRTVHATCVP